MYPSGVIARVQPLSFFSRSLSGATGFDGESKHTIEYKLALDSNPEFTASVLVAYARAVYRMAERGQVGCKTVLDVAPADLSMMSPEDLRKNML